MHAGYNLQIAPVALIGIEGDFTWIGIKASSNTPITAFTSAGVPFTVPGSNLNFQTNVDWLASVRARAGIVQNNWLVYATGGVAWADLSFNANAVCPAPDCNAPGVQASSGTSRTRTGFVVGAGLEWQAPASPWRARAEYLYYGFSGTDSASPLWTSVGGDLLPVHVSSPGPVSPTSAPAT